MITRRQMVAVLADGGRLIGLDGRTPGHITDVVLDAPTSQPAWVTVDSPLCSGAELVVPLTRARVFDGCIQVPYTPAGVCGAPREDGFAGRLHPRRRRSSAGTTPSWTTPIGRAGA